MNYLAHMLCSDDTPASMLGNFLADFVKGGVEGRFPREVVEGIASESPPPERSSSTRRTRTRPMRRGGPARAPASPARCECPPHMTQRRLQSSGLVTKVIRHGPPSEVFVRVDNRVRHNGKRTNHEEPS